MKRKIIGLLLISTLLLSGCSAQNQIVFNKDSNSISENVSAGNISAEFVEIGQYTTGKYTTYLYYDSITNIVLVYFPNGYGGSFTPYVGTNGNYVKYENGNLIELNN